MNKKIYSTIFIIFFTFSHCYGMFLSTKQKHKTLQKKIILKTNIKNDIEKTEEKYFWLTTSDGEKFKLTQTKACENKILNIYIKRFGHANTEKTPLAIGCQESLDNLQEEQFNSLLATKKKLNYAIDINENLTLLYLSDPDRLIAQKIQALEDDSKLSFVLDQIIKLNYIDNQQTRLERDAPKKIYTLDRKFYYIIHERYDDKIVQFYNSENIEVFQFGFKVPFQLTHKKNIIIFKNSKVCYNPITIFYDLDNKNTIKLPILANSYALTHNDQYLIFTNNDRTYYITDISKLPSFKCTILFDNITSSKIYFSPLDKELISISRDTIIKYNIENIKKITNKIIYSVDNESKFDYIELSPDEKHVAIIKNHFINDLSFCKLLNINNPTKKITLMKSRSDYCDYCPFAYKTPFIYSFCSTDEEENSICNFYGQNGDLLHTTIVPNIKVGTSEESVRSLDLGRLSRVFQNTIDHLSKIQANLTTQQLICLQTLCAHQRKPYANLTLQETDPTKKILETFTPDHQMFLKEKLLLSYSAKQEQTVHITQ